MEGFRPSRPAFSPERFCQILANNGRRLRLQAAQASRQRLGNSKHQAAYVAQVDLRFGIARVLPLPPGLFAARSKVVFADPDRHKEVVEHMEMVFRETPLDIVA